MQEKLMGLWAKVVENKAIAIRIAGAVTGAALGVVLASLVSNSQEQNLDDILSADTDEANHELDEE